MCKVLFILGDFGIGGVQSCVMNFVKVVPRDDAAFGVIIHSKGIGFHEPEFKKYGEIYHLPIPIPQNRLETVILLVYNNFYFRKKLVKFLQSHPEYTVVHCKSINYCAAAMEAAKKAGIPVRITHSHVDKPAKMHPFFKWYFHWCSKRIEKSATVRLAVSPGAAEYLYGKNGGRVIKNPTISLMRFDPTKYPPAPHKGIRLIQIGTFCRRKNQCFSVELLHELRKADPDVHLTIIGFSLDEPDYINEIHKKAAQYDLQSSITFLPADSDVPEELSKADYMLIPSLREGLPNVALEAQAMGVPCFISDAVNPDTDAGLCQFLPLAEGAAYWAERIAAYRQEHGVGKTYIDMSAWDSEKVCREYIKLWRNEK